MHHEQGSWSLSSRNAFLQEGGCPFEEPLLDGLSPVGLKDGPTTVLL